MLQGNEPLHSALDVALVSRRTSKAIAGGVLACEIPWVVLGTLCRDYRSMKECDVPTDGSEYQASR